MSLEAAIEKNTVALIELAGKLAAFQAAAGGASKPEIIAAGTRAGLDTAAAARTEQKEPTLPKQAEVKPDPAPAEVKPDPAPTATLDYDRDVKPKALAFAKAKGREALVALLGEFGAKGAAEVPVGKVGEFVGKIDAQLAQG
jgi:hypothetical protein